MKLQQTGYSGGVLSPEIYHNVDMEVRRYGLSEARNMFVRRDGSISKRAGTLHVGETTNSAAGRIIRFDRAVDDVFGLLFGDGTLRTIKDGAIEDFPDPPFGFDTDSVNLTNGNWLRHPGNARYLEGGTTYEMEITVNTAPTANAYISTIGVMIAPDLTLRIARVFDHNLGIVLDTPKGYSYYATTGPALVLGQKHVISYYFGGTHCTVSLDGLQVLRMAMGSVVLFQQLTGHYFTPCDLAMTGGYTIQDAQIECGDATLDYDLHRYTVFSPAQDELWFKPMVNDPTIVPPLEGYIRELVGETDIHDTDTPGTWLPPVGESVVYSPVTSPYAVADLPQLRYAQFNDAIYFTHPKYAEMVLHRLDVGFWQMEPVAYAAELDPPESLAAAASAGAGPDAIKYRVSAVTYDGLEGNACDAITEMWHLGSSWPVNGRVVLTWDLVEGADAYVVYKNSRGQWGYIGTAEAEAFVDDNIAEDISDGPRDHREPLNGAKNHATAVGVHQQRKVYGGSENNRNRFWSTVTGSTANMSIGFPLKDTDAINVDLVAERLSYIQHFLASRDLLAFTSSGTWNVNSGSLREGLTYRNIRFDLEDDTPASWLRPIRAGQRVLMVPEFRRGIREIQQGTSSTLAAARELEAHARARYFPDNYTQANRQIVSWDYDPDDRLIYCVLADGDVLVVTYIPEEGINAWTEWSLGGDVEDVCVIPVGERHVPHFIVNRSGVRSVETLAQYNINVSGATASAVFVDNAYRYQGVATASHPGLTQWANKLVRVLANGSDLGNIAVDGAGLLTLPAAYSSVVAGRMFTAGLTTVDLSFGAADGTAYGDKKINAQLDIILSQTTGLTIGQHEDAPFTMDHDPDDPVLRSGKFEQEIPANWDSNGLVWMQQNTPYPFTLISHISSGESGDL